LASFCTRTPDEIALPRPEREVPVVSPLVPVALVDCAEPTELMPTQSAAATPSVHVLPLMILITSLLGAIRPLMMPAGVRGRVVPLGPA
jgi:hypothetical protein